MSEFAPDTRVVRRSDLLVNDLGDDELVMLDTEAGTYFGLRDVGKVIWERLETSTTVEALCAELLDRFTVDRETCRAETTAFLDSLHEQGLIDVEGPAGNP